MLAYNSKKEIVTIDEALSGVNYYCGKCGGILRVKNGKIRIKHFYHLNEDCGDRGESLIHKYWKKYFLNLKGKEYRGYNIVDVREEFKIKLKTRNENYIPDIVLKTDDNKYIIIEICYTNPKTKEYFEKFKEIKWLNRVYEVKVDFEKIIESNLIYSKAAVEIERIKEEVRERNKKEKLLIVKRKNKIATIYTNENYKKMNGVKRYLIENFSKTGGLEYKNTRLYPILDNKNLGSIKKKIYLSKYNEKEKIKTEPFEINLYNLNIKYIFDNYEDEELGKIEIKIPEYKESLEFSVFIVKN